MADHEKLIRWCRELAARQVTAAGSRATFTSDMYFEAADAIEQLQAIYEAARGLCLGCDWNKGTHARAYRNKLIAAVNGIETLPSLNTIDTRDLAPAAVVVCKNEGTSHCCMVCEDCNGFKG